MRSPFDPKAHVPHIVPFDSFTIELSEQEVMNAENSIANKLTARNLLIRFILRSFFDNQPDNQLPVGDRLNKISFDEDSRQTSIKIMIPNFGCNLIVCHLILSFYTHNQSF